MTDPTANIAEFNRKMSQARALAAQQTPLWKVGLIAFLAMCANDMLATGMVVFEAHYRAVLAGLFDIGGWVTAFICSALALESIIKNGWRTRRSLTIIACISAANFLGTVAGVAIGKGLT